MNDTNSRFHQDLNKIVSDLLVAYQLEFKREVPHLSNPLERWIDFRLRYIDPFPRRIFVSNQFPKKLPTTVEKGLHVLEKLILNGQDVNPYQSKGLVRFTDVSGKRRAKRTDLLWADWGVTHLHITDEPISEGEYFSSRKCSNGESWLLFCIFVGNVVGFIDVRPHRDEFVFADYELIKIVKESWPDYMEGFRLNGITANREIPENHVISTLRANGVTYPVHIGDGVYMPGMGISSASISVLVTTQADKVLDWIDLLVELVNDENGQFQTEVKRHGVENPEFELCLTKRGLAIFEPNANMAFTFSTRIDDENTAHFARMLDLIMPEWALKVLLANSSDSATGV